MPVFTGAQRNKGTMLVCKVGETDRAKLDRSIVTPNRAQRNKVPMPVFREGAQRNKGAMPVFKVGETDQTKLDR